MTVERSPQHRNNVISPSLHPRAHLLILALILALAATLRFFSLSALGFWTDELCALSDADGRGLQLIRVPVNQITPPLPCCTRLTEARSFFEIPRAMARDESHPPLYFMLLRLWMQLWGDSEAAVRSLTVILSLAAIGLLYFTAIESVGSTAALVACLLMAVATPQIQYAQEARNYMLVLVLALLAVRAIQKMRRSPTHAGSILFGCSQLAMMLTHYFAAGAAAGICLFAILNLHGRARRFAITAMIAAAGIFALLWMPALFRQQPAFQIGLGWLSDSAPGHIHRRLLDLCRLPVRFFFEITDPQWQIPVAIAGLILLLWVAVLFLRRPELRLWIFWLIGSIGIVAAADFTRSSTQLNWVRYSLFATPPAYVLLAAGLRGRWRFAPAAVAAIIAIACLHNAYVPAWKIDFQTPVQQLARSLQPTDGLIISGPDAVADAVIFAACQQYMPQLPTTTAVLTAPPNAAVLARLRQCPEVGVIWLWPDKTIRDFVVRDRGQIPYLGTILIGKFRPPTTSP